MAAGSPPPGVTVYESLLYGCADPRNPPAEPYYEATVWQPYKVLMHRFFICSSGATVRIELVADVCGFYYCVVDAYLKCTQDGGCGGFIPIIPAEETECFSYLSGTGICTCGRLRRRFVGDVYLPPGAYVLYAQAVSNGQCAGCSVHYGGTFASIKLRVAAPPPAQDRCLGKEDPCECNCPQGYSEDPVNTRTGNFTHSEVDVSIATRGLPLRFERSYNSLDTAVGPLGKGWTHNYAMRLITGTDRITYVAPRGSRLPFFSKGDGTFDPGPGVRSTLVRNPDGTYRLTRADQVVYHFDAAGRPTALDDGKGNLTTLSYTGADLTRITAPDGRALTLTYEAGRIVSVTDPLSRTTHYTYTGDALTGVTDPLGQTWSYSYDAQGLPTHLTDPAGHSIVNVYDSEGRVIEQRDKLGQPSYFAYAPDHTVITDAAGASTAYSYSQDGLLVATTDPLRNTTHYEYDGDYNLTAVTDPLGRTMRYTWNACGCAISEVEDPLGHVTRRTYDDRNNLLSETDALGRTTRFAYDAHDNLIAITNTLGLPTTFAYDAYGQLVASTDARGNRTEYGYDSYGNLAVVTDSLGFHTEMAYDLAGQLLRISDARGNSTAFDYDAGGRLITATNALGQTTAWNYDALGRPTLHVDANGHATRFEYDPDLNRPEEIRSSLGVLASYVYDEVGNLTRVTDAGGHTTQYTYDPLNRLKTVLDPLQGLTVYDYDPVGKLVSATDARQRARRYSYDALNRLVTVTDPLQNVTAFGYDAVGNTTVITDADHLVTHLAYDALDRLVEVRYADSVVGYVYDAVGNRVAMTDTTGVTTYEYDVLYRPLTITVPYAGPVGYRYDAAGNRMQTRYATGETVTYDYDDANRLQRVSSWATGVTTYTYDAAGRVTGIYLPNGVASSYQYDAVGRLVSIEHRRGDQWHTRFDYQLDLEGNRTAVTETTTALGTYGLPALGRGETTGGAEGAGSGFGPVGGTVRYAYDAGDRLVAARYGHGDRYEYAYDSVGNRTVYTVTLQGADEVTYYSYDDADRLAGVDGTPITYDRRGNQLTDGTWTYTYDGAGRLVRAESLSATHVYTYNGDGLLVAQNLNGVETVFIWDQALALPQVLATSDGLRVLYGLGRIGVEQGGTWHYPQTDALGSVRQWTDAEGAVVGLQGYGPYGEPIVPLGPPLAPWGYTGEWHDPAGLVYLRARWYHPGLGRFTQVDPVVGPLMAPATRRAYTYGLSNPLSYKDPSGRSVPWVVIGVAAVAGLIDYGIQVSRNRQAGLDWGAALTANINVREILSVAGAAGLATMAVPELVSAAGMGLSAAGFGLYGLSQSLGAASGAIPQYVSSSAAWASATLWSAGTAALGAAQTVAGAIYGLKTCPAPAQPARAVRGTQGFKVEGQLKEIWGNRRYFEAWLKNTQSVSRIGRPLSHVEARQVLENARNLGIGVDVNQAGLQGLETRGTWAGIPHFKVGRVHIPVEPGFVP